MIDSDPSQRLLEALFIRLGDEQALRKQAEARATRAEQLAYIDPGTGVPNRRFFDMYLGQVHEAAVAGGFGYSLVVVDIDLFKSVNDTHGHAAGDRIIRNIAGILCQGHRTEDMVAHLQNGVEERRFGIARFGGEEFAVVLPLCSRENAEKIAEEMRRAVANHTHDLSDVITKDGIQALAKTASFGVATFDLAIDDGANSVFARADFALYCAKQDYGRNVVVASTGSESFVPVDRTLDLGRAQRAPGGDRIFNRRTGNLAPMPSL